MTVQPLLARRPAQEQGRLRLHQPHDRGRPGKGRPRRGGGAARRAVPRRRGRPHPPEAHRGQSAGRGDRPARQSVSHHRHPGGHPGLRPRARKRRRPSKAPRRAVHRRQPRLPVRQEPERSVGENISRRSSPPTRRARTSDKYSHVAAFDEIAENDFNLNIPRYVDTFEEEAEIDVAAVEKEIDQLESELAKVRKKMKQYLKELGV